MKLVGRDEERRILNEALTSSKAEMVVVIGRRRVGKTFMIREHYKKDMLIDFVGIYRGNQKEHMERFSKIEKSFMKGGKELSNYILPSNWFELFDRIEKIVERTKSKAKKVIFLDELPWMGGSNSKFVKALGHFWNAWASKRNDIVLVLSGSATSWILKKIFQDKGGLYNRTTRKIHLKPFSLLEAEQFLLAKKIKMERDMILEYYMIFGGIPYYLDLILPGESVVQTVDRLFFNKQSSLNQEFNELYASLFEDSIFHELITKILAQHPMGLTRDEILHKLNVQSGGSYSKVFHDLEYSHFITGYLPFGKKSRDRKFKLTDPFILFFFKYVYGSQATKMWEKTFNTPKWKSWSGLAFENLCHLHIVQIKKALEISGILAETSLWYHLGNSDMDGAQIDLLIDRSDKIINLCEMKYYHDKVAVNKDLITKVKDKISSFRFFTGTRKTIYPILISPQGVARNDQTFFSRVIVTDDLFK